VAGILVMAALVTGRRAALKHGNEAVN
jgi:hypothetical protein